MDQEALEFIQDFATNKWGACTRVEEIMIGHVAMQVFELHDFEHADRMYIWTFDPIPSKDSKLFWTSRSPTDEEFEKSRVEAES